MPITTLTCSAASCIGTDIATAGLFATLQTYLNGAIRALDAPFTFASGSKYLPVDGALTADAATVATQVYAMAVNAGVTPPVFTKESLAASADAVLAQLKLWPQIQPYSPWSTKKKVAVVASSLGGAALLGVGIWLAGRSR